ncbi:MAG: flagellar protein FlgN [Ruminococcus sp.]|nr:flagellar protein FlgN [Ruminococcus sp.]
MERFNEYYDFMKGYLSFFEGVKDNERNKMHALLSNDLKKIESAMQQHQSDVKKIELMEKQRRELSERLGFGQMDFSAIIDLFEGDERNKLWGVKNNLQITVKNIQYLNRKSMEIANLQLNYYGELAADEEARLYNAKGKPEVAAANLLNTKA